MSKGRPSPMVVVLGPDCGPNRKATEAGLLRCVLIVMERTLSLLTPIFPNRHQDTTAKYDQRLHLSETTMQSASEMQRPTARRHGTLQGEIFTLQDVSAFTLLARFKVFASATKLKTMSGGYGVFCSPTTSREWSKK